MDSNNSNGEADDTAAEFKVPIDSPSEATQPSLGQSALSNGVNPAASIHTGITSSSARPQTPRVVQDFINQNATEPTPLVPTTESQPQPATPPADFSPAPSTAPAQPEPAPSPAVGGSSGSVDGQTMVPPLPSKGKRWLKPLIAFSVALVVLGGGYAFAFYIPNRPGTVYKTGLENTGKAADKLVEYLQKEDTTNYVSTTATGTVNAKSASGSFDVSVNGAYDKNGNSNTTLDGNFVGVKVNADVRTVDVKSSTSPDIYFKVRGVKSMLDSVGLSQVSQLDGQWVEVDHTLLDTLLANFSSDAQASKDKFKAPTTEQINDAVTKVQNVNKQYLFTTDASKAVLVNKQFIGKETQNGRTAYRYTVGYSKQNLRAYVGSLKVALDSSKLNDWSRQVTGKSLSESADFKSTDESIKKANANYTADLWIDAKTKLVSSLRFTHPSNKASYFTISQNFTGGDVYPFSFLNVENEDGRTSRAMVNFKIDTKAHKYTLDMSGEETAGSSKTSFTGKFELTPSKDTVKVEVPKSAKSATEILTQLGMSGEALAPSKIDAGTQSQAKDTERETDINAIRSHLEAYYADNGFYPTLTQLNTPSWLSSNLRGLEPSALQDPDGTVKTLASAPAPKIYAYQATTSAGTACSGKTCQKYTLTATLSTGERYVKKSLNE